MAKQQRSPGWRVLLERRSFRLLWGARTVSFIGDTVGRTALLLYVQESEESGLAVGVLLGAMAVPRLLSPIAGTFADRVDQRYLMMAAEGGRIVVVSAMVLFLPPFPALLVLVALSTVLSTLFAPAGRSSIPELVDKDQLGPANSLIGTAANLGLAIGPGVAGFAFASIGVRGTLGLDVATSLIALLLLARLPSLRPNVEGQAASFWADVREGVTVVASHSTARAATLGLLLLVAFLALDNAATVFLARDVLHAGPEGFGMLGTAWGVGMIIGSVLMIDFSRRRRPGSLFLLGAFLSGVGVLAAAGSPAIFAAVIALGIGGVGNGISNVATDTLIQEHVERRIRGRVFGLAYAGALTGDSLASLLGGPLVDVTSPRITLAIAGGGALIVLVLVRLLIPEETRGRREVPPAK